MVSSSVFILFKIVRLFLIATIVSASSCRRYESVNSIKENYMGILIERNENEFKNPVIVIIVNVRRSTLQLENINLLEMNIIWTNELIPFNFW